MQVQHPFTVQPCEGSKPSQGFMMQPSQIANMSTDAISSLRGSRSIGVITTILGFLLMCCLCPLAINAIVIVSTVTRTVPPTSIYGQLFSARVGNLTLATYISATQNVCSSILAVIVLATGIVTLVRSRGASPEQR